MTKKELEKKLEQDISLEQKIEYLNRLSKPYIKNNKKKIFFDQYMNGDGSELKCKFWSKHSSSRIAFDLYSCLANDNTVDDFEFEYQLPGILFKNKESGVPNMDVYYQKGSTIYFIESKFTESPKDSLPQAYYIDTDEYKNTKNQLRVEPIKNRFRNNSYVASEFSRFSKNYKDKTEHIDKKDWFNYKQEICHLFGIIFYAKEKITTSTINQIDFRNIVYDFDDYEILGKDHISQSALEFINDAKDLINRIFEHEKINIKFSYNYDFIQRILPEYENKNAYGTELSVKDIMKQYLIG